MESIGVITLDPWFILDHESLISKLFYFDRILFKWDYKESLQKFSLAITGSHDNFKGKQKEIENLEKSGLAIEYSEDEYDHDRLKFGDRQVRLYSERSLALSLGFSTEGKPFRGVLIDFLERFRAVSQIDSRICSVLLNRKSNDSFTPIIRNRIYGLDLESDLQETAVLTVLMRRFPILNDNLDFEKFVDFKKDPDTQVKLARLRNWVLEISKEHYTEKEIEQKIEWLLNEYIQQLEIYKLKFHFGFTEIIVTTSLEIIEGLLKLKFGKIAEALFKIGQNKITLLEAEQNAIGRELAYIYKVKQKQSQLIKGV